MDGIKTVAIFESPLQEINEQAARILDEAHTRNPPTFLLIFLAIPPVNNCINLYLKSWYGKGSALGQYSAGNATLSLCWGWFVRLKDSVLLNHLMKWVCLVVLWDPDSVSVLTCAITIYCGLGVSKIQRQAHESILPENIVIFGDKVITCSSSSFSSNDKKVQWQNRKDFERWFCQRLPRYRAPPDGYFYLSKK